MLSQIRTMCDAAERCPYPGMASDIATEVIGWSSYNSTIGGSNDAVRVLMALAGIGPETGYRTPAGSMVQGGVSLDWLRTGLEKTGSIGGHAEGSRRVWANAGLVPGLQEYLVSQGIGPPAESILVDTPDPDRDTGITITFPGEEPITPEIGDDPVIIPDREEEETTEVTTASQIPAPDPTEETDLIPTGPDAPTYTGGGGGGGVAPRAPGGGTTIIPTGGGGGPSFGPAPAPAPTTTERAGVPWWAWAGAAGAGLWLASRRR